MDIYLIKIKQILYILELEIERKMNQQLDVMLML